MSYMYKTLVEEKVAQFLANSHPDSGFIWVMFMPLKVYNAHLLPTLKYLKLFKLFKLFNTTLNKLI